MNSEKEDMEKKDTAVCTFCGDIIEDTSTMQVVRNKIYCARDFKRLFTACRDCGDITAYQDSRAYSFGFICQHCYSNSYYTCNACENVSHNNNECCSENEYDYNLPEREYDTSDKFCIQSERAYSCEIECYYPKSGIMTKVANTIDKEIGIVGDGSLDNNGVEFNTPKLGGVRGAKLLQRFTKTLKDNNFSVNTTCGLHVHLDGKDIIETSGALQKLMIFFMLYEDVIMSFLPLSRRDNRYCLPLSEFYHLKEIKDCYSKDDFEEIWYRDDNRENREERKKDRHDSSRYAGVNFHSLLANGHLEIRYHSGTINYEKINNWIKLFVLIMDEIQHSCTISRSPNLSLNQLIKTKFILGLPEKTLSFFNAINLSQEQRDYFLARQKKFIGGAEEETN